MIFIYILVVFSFYFKPFSMNNLSVYGREIRQVLVGICIHNYMMGPMM